MMTGGFQGPSAVSVFLLSGVVSLWLSFHQRTGHGLVLFLGLFSLALLVASVRLITGESFFAASAGAGVFAGPFLFHLAFPEISALRGEGPYAVIWLVGTVGILVFTLVFSAYERSLRLGTEDNHSSQARGGGHDV